jgi:glycerol-3-phosphate dehydrogenase
MSQQRADRLERLRQDSAFDVVVVGGGVNGIGVYRELSLQGLRVLLVERHDFASGCSSALSRMIHGGLRYLENGEFSLVRESLAERDALLATAPHMVRPLPTMIPLANVTSGLFNSASQFFGNTGKPARRGAVPVKLGLTLYDWITRTRRRLPKHRFFSGSDTRRLWPELTPSAICSAVYYDAWISRPERLCIEMIRDVSASGSTSVALNYAELSVGDGKYAVTCQVTKTTLQVTPRVVVNATGAWLDETVKLLGGGEQKRMVSGTKGSHLILDNPALAKAMNGHMIYFENLDGRVCITFPYLGHVLAGATDIRVPDASRQRCEDDERDYILASLRQIFPTIRVGIDDIIFSFSGVRPLPTSDHDFTGRISRGHSIRRLAGGIPQFCMIGGKWTTFRAFAKQTSDVVLAELGHARVTETDAIAIGGGDGFPADPARLERHLVETFNVSPQRAAHLVDHYGSKADAVQSACAADANDKPVALKVPYTLAEIRHLIVHEHVETLSDLVLRRTSLAITGAISMAVIDTLAQLLGSERKMSPEKISAEKQNLIEELQSFHGVSPAALCERDNKWRNECA